MKTKTEVKHTPYITIYHHLNGISCDINQSGEKPEKFWEQDGYAGDENEWFEEFPLPDNIVKAVNSHDEILRLLKAMTDQVDKHFYKLPEDNENDGKYWKRLYESACEAIAQAEK